MSPRSLAAAALLLVAALPAHAGPHSDALAKCLVASTNPEDRVALVRWMFAAFAAHPSVAPMSSVTPPELEQIDQAALEAVGRESAAMELPSAVAPLPPAAAAAPK